MFKKLKQWWRDFSCSHVFDPPEMQTRDENGIVRWPCMKCRHVFSSDCGINILSHGSCTGRWGGQEPLYKSGVSKETAGE